MPFRILYGTAGGDTDAGGGPLDPAVFFAILCAVLLLFCGPIVLLLGARFLKQKNSAKERENDGLAECQAGPCRGFDMQTCLPVSAAAVISIGVLVLGVIRLAMISAAEPEDRGWEAAQGGLAVACGCMFASVIKFRYWS
eukprot:SAG31_NODE_9454_length_1275_cov_0.818878_3_plen_139_part_01